jgi:hypothetical protein
MPDRTDPEAVPPSPTDPVAAARHAIWLLFEDGQLDVDHATEALLAIDVGIRRMHRRRADAEHNP